MACKKIIWGTSTLPGDGGAKVFNGIDNTVQCDCDACEGNDVDLYYLMMRRLGKSRTEIINKRASERRKAREAIHGPDVDMDTLLCKNEENEPDW